MGVNTLLKIAHQIVNSVKIGFLKKWRGKSSFEL